MYTGHCICLRKGLTLNMPFLKKILLPLIYLINSSYAIGQDVSDTAFEKTIFWKVTGNGLSSPSYLFGTAHPIFREDIRVADTMLHVLLRCRSVYFEYIPAANEDSLYRQLNLMKKPNLKKLLGNICYTKLIKTLEKYKDTVLMDPLFNSLTPQYLGSRLMKNAFGKQLTSLDAILMAIALGNDQQVFPLDKPAIREEMNEWIPLDQQASNLYNFVNDFDQRMQEFAAFTRAMTAKYYEGDLAFLYTRVNFIRINDRMIGSRTHRIPGIEELLDKRNKQWLPVMEEACKKESSFFAFGAAHLGGKKGIITLLRRKGYIVTPIFL